MKRSNRIVVRSIGIILIGIGTISSLAWGFSPVTIGLPIGLTLLWIAKKPKKSFDEDVQESRAAFAKDLKAAQAYKAKQRAPTAPVGPKRPSGLRLPPKPTRPINNTGSSRRIVGDDEPRDRYKNQTTNIIDNSWFVTSSTFVDNSSSSNACDYNSSSYDSGSSSSYSDSGGSCGISD
jgi:hypothetical protein